MQDAIPASTVIIFRETRTGPPELLMVERARAMAFAGGAMVFPGGRIDPGDHALAETIGSSYDDAAARIAAIRETIEEAGLPIGLSPLPDTATFAEIRTRLHAGDPLGPLLRQSGLRLELQALTPFARWRPAHEHMRIFDTRFYLAGLPDGSPEAEIDATENVGLAWMTAQEVLAAADAGRVRIIFPTRRNLERLALFASLDEARAHAAAYPVRTITPWIDRRGAVDHLCIDDDLGYPVTSEPLRATDRA